MNFSEEQAKMLAALADFILAGRKPGKTVGPAADDSDLDGKFGNPTVRKDPKFWEGPSMVGRTYSQCPAEFLIKLAELLEWSAGKDQEKGDAARKSDKGVPYWKYNLQDAARARGWAARNQGKTGNPYGADPFDAPAAPAAEVDPDLPF